MGTDWRKATLRRRVGPASRTLWPRTFAHAVSKRFSRHKLTDPCGSSPMDRVASRLEPSLHLAAFMHAVRRGSSPFRPWPRARTGAARLAELAATRRAGSWRGSRARRRPSRRGLARRSATAVPRPGTARHASGRWSPAVPYRAASARASVGADRPPLRRVPGNHGPRDRSRSGWSPRASGRCAQRDQPR